jgi:S1-C subfamily serine protease
MPRPLLRALLALAVVDIVQDFLGELRQHRPGDRVNVTVVRDGREQQVTVTLADNPNG